MIVALNSDKAAAGDLFWDDGETINTISTNQYHYIRFSYTETLVSGVVSSRLHVYILQQVIHIKLLFDFTGYRRCVENASTSKTFKFKWFGIPQYGFCIDLWT